MTANGCKQFILETGVNLMSGLHQTSMRVCLRPFRDGDCNGFPSRPRISSRAFRRRFKVSARPGWRAWARGVSTPRGAKLGKAPPVGVVSTFRSADGQPAVRQQAFDIVLFSAGRVTVRSCNQSDEVGTCWRRRAFRDRSPTCRDGLQHAQNARPLLPQLGADTDRTGRLCFR